MVEVSYVGNRGSLFPGPQHGSDRLKFADAGPSAIAIRTRTSTVRRRPIALPFLPDRPAVAHDSITNPIVQARFPQFKTRQRERHAHRPIHLPGLPRSAATESGIAERAAVGWRLTVAWTADGQDLVRLDAGKGDQAVFTRVPGRRQLHLGQRGWSSGRLPTAPSFWAARP